MPEDTPITELTEFDATKVSGVPNPANGTPWLLLKAADSHDADTESAEADAIESELTKAAGMGFCGTDCHICDSKFGPIAALLKAKLKAADRKALPDSDFAIPEKAPGSGSYPIPDESHARDALARSSGKPEEDRVRRAVHAKFPDIEISKEAEPVEKSPGVPDFATATPEANGHIEGSGKSGLAGPATTAPADCHSDPALSEGGETPYGVPAEAKAFCDGPASEATKPMNFEAAKDTWEIEVVDNAEKGNWLAVDNPLAPAPAAPVGSSAWETYDATSLDQVARGLAAASRAVNDIAKREATEAINGDASDWFDAYDLGCACDDINQALSLVARLAYHEAAAEKQGAEKAGRRLSTKTESALRAARDHLTDILGEGAQPKPKEADAIMATVTKEELASFITKAVQDELKADRKARKQARKAKAEKNANNGGDITAESERACVHGEHDADDVNAVQSGSPKAGVTKSDDDTAIKSLTDQLSEMRELVEKMASRPRSGGPVLDGVARGSFPAAEGRMTETATKSEADGEVEKLEKELAEAVSKSGPEWAARASDLSQNLTLARLRRAHASGLI